MDYEAWRFWLDELHWILASIFAVGSCILGWLFRRLHVLGSRIHNLDEDTDGRMDGHEQRLAAIESAIEHGPKKDDFRRIYERLEQVGESVARIEGSEKAMARNINLIHEHLLKP